jgi:hypothetical protein
MLITRSIWHALCSRDNAINKKMNILKILPSDDGTTKINGRAKRLRATRRVLAFPPPFS